MQNILKQGTLGETTQTLRQLIAIQKGNFFLMKYAYFRSV
jgi:hypothetical protein